MVCDIVFYELNSMIGQLKMANAQSARELMESLLSSLLSRAHVYLSMGDDKRLCDLL